MNWFRASRKEPGWLAISLDENRLSYVHGRYAPAGKSTIARFGNEEFEAKLHAAGKLAKELRVHRYQCTTLLRPDEYQMLLLEVPAVPPSELKSAIRWKIKDMIDYRVEDATLDVLDIPPESDSPGRSHSMYAVAARNEVIKGRIKAFEDAHIPIGVIDIPETAQRNISALHETEGRGAALLYFSQEFGLLTITCRAELYLSRRIDIGLGQILGAAAEARETLFGRVVLELQRSFDHFERQFQHIPVAKLLLGPEPEETGLHAHLKANMDIAVERVDLLERLGFNGQGAPEPALQWQLFHLIGASLRHDAKAP